MSTTINAAKLAQIIRQVGTVRNVTAIAGPPGAGKSTLAEQLTVALNRIEPGAAAILAMDGYHLDDIVLNTRGHRPRKGAPHTFDVGGYQQMLMRLRTSNEAEIVVPVFDRAIEIARAGAGVIPDTARHIITEGNYLLLDQEPWLALAPLFDRTVFIEVSRATLKQRLAERWQDLPEERKAAKLNQNDLPNVDLVQNHSRSADYTIRQA